MKPSRILKSLTTQGRGDKQLDSLANLRDYLQPGEELQFAVPVSTGSRLRFFGYVGLTEKRLLLVLSDHPRRRRPFEMLGGVHEFSRPVMVRSSWRLNARIYGFVAIKTSGRTLWLQPWGEPLRPLAEYLRNQKK